MANQELRQGRNAITLFGEVKEHKLKLNEKDGDRSIGGSLVVKTGEFSDIEVSVYVAEKTKEGKVKKAFETLNRFIDEDLKTRANATEDEPATRVKIQGSKDFTPKFKEDIFKVKETGEVMTKLKVELGFGNIVVVNDLKEEDFKAEFDVEIYIKSIREEVKDDNETGRVLISGLLPVYGGKVIPIELVAGTVSDEDGEFDFGREVIDNVEEGSTINFWGKFNYETIITTKKKGGTLGRAKIEEERKYINELVAEGGEPIEDKEFDMELIKQAKIERDKAIEAKKNEEVSEQKKGVGLGGKSSDKPRRERPRF